MDVHLIADAHNGSALEVMHIPGLDKNTKIKSKVFAVVNDLLGTVFLDFTTGNTGLRLCHIQPTAPFKVSQGLDLHMGDSCCSNRSLGLGFRLNTAYFDSHMTERYFGICLNSIATVKDSLGVDC